jgi:hypothetical protein
MSFKLTTADCARALLASKVETDGLVGLETFHVTNQPDGTSGLHLSRTG